MNEAEKCDEADLNVLRKNLLSCILHSPTKTFEIIDEFDLGKSFGRYTQFYSDLRGRWDFDIKTSVPLSYWGKCGEARWQRKLSACLTILPDASNARYYAEELFELLADPE